MHTYLDEVHTYPSAHTRTPTPLMRYCLTPGCRNRVESGRCAQHSRTRSSTAKGYGSDWQEFRQQAVLDVLGVDFPRGGPLCVRCLDRGIITAMNELDHIVPLELGGRRLDPLNVQSLCTPCHRAKTEAEITARAKDRSE